MDELFELLVKTFGRFLAYVIKEIIFEILFRGPGYLITRTYRSTDEIDIDHIDVILWSIVFWVAVGGGLYWYFNR